MHRIAIATAVIVVAQSSVIVYPDVITAEDSSAWHDDFAAIDAWQARQDWLSNADTSASVSSVGGVACFQVDAPGKGMKWSRSTRPVSLDEAPYLFLRYRAVNLKTDGEDYLVYLDDGVPSKECRPIRLSDVVAEDRKSVV